MKKSLAVFAILLVAAIGFLGYFQFSLLASKDKITFEDNILHGNPAMIEGMTINVRNEYKRHLFWDTTYEAGAVPTVSTDYTFYDTAKAESYTPVNYFFMDVEIPVYDFDPQTPREEQIGILKTAYDLYHSPSYNQENIGAKRKNVFLKDYYEFYPFTYNILVGNHDRYLGYLQYSSQGVSISGEGEADYEFLKNYFRIPVLKDDVRSLVVSNHTQDRVGVSLDYAEYTENEKSYFFNSYSVVTDHDIYFTFSFSSDGGTSDFDDSYLPAGHGIYRIPYTTETKDKIARQKADIQSLSMVFPLDTSTEIFNFCKTNDESKLILAYRDNATPDSAIEIAIIDTLTLEILQTFLLNGIEKPDGSTEVLIPYDMYIYDDFIAVLCSGSYIALFELNNSGLYHLSFVINIQENPIFDSYLRGPGRTVMDLKDGKLAVVSHVRRNIEDYIIAESCGFYIAVFDKSGLVYYSTHASSLDKGESFYNNMVQPVSYNHYYDNKQHESEASLQLVWE